MKHLIPYLLLLMLTSCYTIKSSVVDRLEEVWPENLHYHEDGIYKSGKDTIISKPKIKYYPVYIYRTTPYFNHYYTPYRYPNYYNQYYPYNNYRYNGSGSGYSPSFSNSNRGSRVTTPSAPTPSSSPSPTPSPSSGRSKSGKIQ